jgi:hypothetical protein
MVYNLKYEKFYKSSSFEVMSHYFWDSFKPTLGRLSDQISKEVILFHT